MSGERLFVFARFTLNPSTDCLLCGSTKIPLRPKSFALLHYLLEHPTRLVTKPELMEAAWPATKVADSALKVSIWEIRRALEDTAEAPKFIETIGGKGYRFIAPVGVQFSAGTAQGDKSPQHTYLVGRSSDLQQLESWVRTARHGNRQMIFVTGEPGIGKTTLIEALVRGVSTDKAILVAHGQCVEQYGAGEPYLPILDAVERLCRTPKGNEVSQLLRQYAPSWLVNFPAVTDPGERPRLEQQRVGVTPERLLREITSFFEALAREQTVFLVLEDLHWADPSSLSLISFLGRRQESAQLALLATYREDDVRSGNHQLNDVRQELQLHDLCRHLLLGPLDENAVSEYLKVRFTADHISPRLVALVYRQSEGNPLFMISVTDTLLNQQNIQTKDNFVALSREFDVSSVPSTIRQLAEAQMERLTAEELEIVEVASVAGTRFSAASLAAGLGESLEQVEIKTQRLARRGIFLQATDTERWLDGTSASRYAFNHALYQNVIYEGITGSKKMRLHHAIGKRLEAGYRGATDDVATELALHFERAGDHERAATYFSQAAARAVRQCGYLEAINDTNAGLKLTGLVPSGPQKNELELSLQFLKGISIASAKGYASAESREPFSRARSLLRTAASDSLAFQTLAGLWSFELVRGKLRSALELGQQMLGIAKRTRDPTFSLIGHMAVGVAFFYLGDLLTARRHLENSSTVYDPKRHWFETSVYGWDPVVVVACYKSKTSWLLGYPRKAHLEAERAISLTQKLSSPFHAAFSNALLAAYYGYRGRENEALQAAEIATKVSNDLGFDHPLALGTIVKGWALEKKSGGAGDSTLEDGIRRWKAMGAELGMTLFLAFRAEASLLREEFEKGLTSIEAGLMISKKTADHHYDAELYRLKGELLLKSRDRRSKNNHLQLAEKSLRHALNIARRQRAMSLELKATLSLCSLWQKMGKKEAKKVLAKAYGRFTEGFDFPELKAARASLEKLG